MSFADQAFGLVLSAHCLFLDDDRPPYKFHRKAVQKLLRISDQTRVFPLQGFEAKRSGYVAKLSSDIQ